MNRLILSTTMTVDGVISVSDWYVSEGEHDRAARAFWVHPAVWGRGERPFHGEEQVGLDLVGSETFDSSVTLLRYEPGDRLASEHGS